MMSPVAREIRLASPTTALVMGVLVVVSQAASVAISILGHESTLLAYGVISVVTLSFGAVGVVVARHEPHNPIGWILAAVSLSFIVCTTGAANYLALDYGSHHGRLPLGDVAIVVGQGWPIALMLGPLAILLFPDGRLLTRRWRVLVVAYIVAATVVVATQVMIGLSAIIEQRVRVNSGGNLTSASPWPLSNGAASVLGGLLVVFVVGCWPVFLGRQIASYRRASGERRQQLKWVLCGAAITAASIPGFVSGGGAHSLLAHVAVGASVVGLAALPLSIGVGMLRYRLYEIDRLISRTLAYALVTGLLVGVYFGIVALATDVLPFSSPIAVAASTLAAAALFNPLRRRIQRIVDRRFNRARYDADATVTAFATQLRDAIDLTSIGSDLVGAVDRSVAPAHASLWIRKH